MKNKEILLTNIPKIVELKLAGFTYSEIAEEINQASNLNIKERTIRNVFYYIKNNTLNKKYNTFALFDLSTDVGILIEYSIIAHGLIITTPAIANYFELSHQQLNKDNFKKKTTTEEGILYAKRLLRQYWVSDKDIIDHLRKTNPPQQKIDYPSFINKLHTIINEEVNNWIFELKKITKKYLEMKGTIL